MEYIKEKNGNKLDYQFMKKYTIDKMEQKFKNKINKKSQYVKCLKMTKKSISELIDLVEKEFGKDGVIVLFLNEYDFTGIPDEEFDNRINDLIKQSKKRKLQLSFINKIKIFFEEIYIYFKNFIILVKEKITYPFINYFHSKKYFLPKKISNRFSLYFLITIIRNLEYYKNNFEKIFPYEGSLSEQEKQTIQNHINYQLAYYTLSDSLNQFDYLKDFNLFKGMDEESFIKIQETIREVRNIRFEKNSKLVTFIQEEMVY